jgi:phenylpropionate dioxygenase-like ring-hydroxylating dioxygenase large terminal subunit
MASTADRPTTHLTYNPADLVLEDRVHRRIYTDPVIFEQELQRIFHRTWVYVGHDSEIPTPGEYKLAYVGKQPVIVTRDEAGQIHVLFNRCRHRAAMVCTAEQGKVERLRCPYHGWTYGLNGLLVGVPYRDGYDSSFDQREWSLVPVPRLAVYRGFIFASLNPDVCSIEEHLGNAREYIDEFVNTSPEGEIVARSGGQKTCYDGNWKLQVENAVDCYHPGYTHQSFFETRKWRGEGAYVMQTGFSRSVVRDLGNGHAALDRRPDTQAEVTAKRLERLKATPAGARYFADLEARFGPERAEYYLSSVTRSDFNLAVFPNLILLNVQIRTVRPLAVDRTEVTLQPVLLKGAPEALNAIRLREHEEFYGPAGLAAPDDIEMFNRVQEGLQVEAIEWLLVARGLHREWTEGSTRVSNAEDETHQRGQYAEWRRLMLAGAG